MNTFQMPSWAEEGGESASLILRLNNIPSQCHIPTKSRNFFFSKNAAVYLCRHDNHKILVTDLVFFEGFVIAEDFSWKETE